jgi:hypothetical protein
MEQDVHKEISMRKLVVSLGVAGLLTAGMVTTPAASAAVPGARDPGRCQGYDVSHYQANNSPSASGPFGSVVSGFAHSGQLVGFVRGAADCGVN